MLELGDPTAVLMQEQQEKEPAGALPQGTPLEVEAASLLDVLVLGEAALMVVASCLLLMVEEAELGDADQLSHPEAWVRPTSGSPQAASSALTPERRCSPDYRQPHQ